VGNVENLVTQRPGTGRPPPIRTRRHQNSINQVLSQCCIEISFSISIQVGASHRLEDKRSSPVPCPQSGRSRSQRPLRQLQSCPDVLLYQQDRHSLPVDLGDHLKHLLHQNRRQPKEGSSSSNSLGLDIKARPMASICRSPPLRVPAAGPSFPQAGKIPNTHLRLRPDLPGPGDECPSSRFSRTLIPVNIFHLGHLDMPSSTIL